MLRFSKNAQSMRTSEIRDLMSLATRPDIISFSGGMPGNELFPVAELDEIYQHLSVKEKQAGMQYGPTPGYPPLLESLSAYLKSKGLPVEKNKLLITTGSLQAISLLGKIFLDPGDEVICEDPCFIGGISVFKSYQANMITVPLDEDGILIEELERRLDQHPQAKLLYLTPYFHNPAGIIYSLERKAAVLKVLRGRKLVLLEDDPYGELYFDEKDKLLTVPMKTVADEPVPICYIGSFSKIFGPGMRLGWLLATEEIYQKCELAKQSADACTATFTQVLADKFLREGKLPPYVARLREAYARRVHIMLQALGKYMPQGIRWNIPKGGFYIWVQLPEGMVATELLKKAITAGAVFVTGKTFDPHGVRDHCLRLAFSHTPEDKIEEGVRIIAEAIKSYAG